LRYALLFSGMSFRRHVNGLEFCYRTLVDHLGFAADNVRVLNYDGSLSAFGDPEGEPCGAWPGDGTPYRMVVNAEGSREAFRHELGAIGEKLTPSDQLFINTTGHGGHHGHGRGPDLVTYPYCERFRCRDFCADLATLPPHQSLVVLMAQCFSGGFNQAVVDASRAGSTFIASATCETQQSFMSFEDRNWDAFQRNWIAALARRDVDGAAIRIDADRAGSGPVSVRTAFEYASGCPGRSPYDSPEWAARPRTAGEMTLSEHPVASLVAA
jgi:peptidase C13-like protein